MLRNLWIVLALACAASTTWGCGSDNVPAGLADTLHTRIEGIGGKHAFLRGERLLEPKAVTRFYQGRKNQRAWGRPGAADQILKAIDDVEKDGLMPADYHRRAIAALLEERTKGNSAGVEADLDLLLTDAVAGMMDHLHYGRVQPIQLNPAWNVDLREGAPALDSVVARVAAAPAVAAAIADARPQHFIYRGLVAELARLREIEARGGWPAVRAGPALRPAARDRRIAAVRRRLVASGDLEGGLPADSTRYDARLQEAVKRFQEQHRLEPSGVIDAATVEAMNVTARDRIDQVRANLERARWTLEGLRDDFLLVNLPAFKAYLIRGGRNEWETRTMIGQEARQTPSFKATLRSIVFNPDWTVPPTILAEDILNAEKRPEEVIAKKKLIVLDQNQQEVDPTSIDWGSMTPENFPYTLRQPPGPDNVLGHVKFLFPNPFSIYLHDTSSPELFKAKQRSVSSGCIRVEHALDLAERLLQGQDAWNAAKIQEVVDQGETHEVKLEHPLAILIAYWTVSVGASGDVHYARDVYGLDPPLVAALSGR